MIGSAFGAGAAVAAARELCPHEAARARGVVVVPKGRRGSIALCIPCKRGFERIVRQFGAGELSPRELVAQVVEMGYSRTDGALLLLELIARRLRVRLGFREAI